MKAEKYELIKNHYNSRINEKTMVQTHIEEYIKKIQKKRDEFVLNKVEEHCNWWQKIYFKLALKYEWKVWFVELLQKNSDYYQNEKYGFRIDYYTGCKINGKEYWM